MECRSRASAFFFFLSKAGEILQESGYGGKAGKTEPAEYGGGSLFIPEEAVSDICVQ